MDHDQGYQGYRGDRGEATAGHRQLLLRLSADGGVLTASGPGATVNNPDWFTTRGGVARPRSARRDLHSRLLEQAEARQGEVAADRQAIVLAGPPGAGKSSVVASVLADMGSSPQQWRTVNSDDFKDDLLEQALADGSYRSRLTRGLDEASGGRADDLQPRELASLVHQESGLLARALRQRAVERGDNLLLDGTLSDEGYARQVLGQLSAAGYKVHLVHVEAPRQVVGQRIDARWRTGREAAQAGTGEERENRLGGRWVPPSFADSLYPPGRPERSTCADVVSALTADVPLHSAQVYEVTTVEAAPQLAGRLPVLGAAAGAGDGPGSSGAPRRALSMSRARGRGAGGSSTEAARRGLPPSTSRDNGDHGDHGDRER